MINQLQAMLCQSLKMIDHLNKNLAYHILSFKNCVILPNFAKNFHRKFNIPGDSSEEQILLAGQLYLDRPTVLENVLNDLFQIFRSDTCQNLKLALEAGLYLVPFILMFFPTTI